MTYRSSLVLSVAWLMFAVLNLFLNGQFWAWELLSAVPTPFWILIGTILILLTAQKRNLSLMLVAIIATILMVPYVDIIPPRLPVSATNISHKLSVFNWNTLAWHDDDPSKFIEFLKKQDADIYHLQEAFNYQYSIIDAKSYLKEAFPEYHFVQQGELVTISRYPIISTEHSVNYSLWQGVLRTDIQINHNNENSIVSTYNVHLPVPFQPDRFENISQFTNKIQDLFNARQQHINYLMKDISNNKYPKIVTGDFNSTQFQPIIWRVQEELKEGYSQVGWGAPRTFKFYGMKLWRIDWVFTSNQINTVSFRQITKPKISDHDAIKVEFSLS